MTISIAARQIAGPHKGTPWSEGDIAILREMRAAGHSAPTIALRLGRTVGAVYAEAKKAGSQVMPRKAWTPEESARLADLHSTGVPDTVLAEKLGRSYGSVRARIDLLGLVRDRATYAKPRGAPGKPRRKRMPGEGNCWTLAQIETLKELSGEVTLKTAASRIGRPLSGVRAKAKEMGVTFLRPVDVNGKARDARLVEAWARHQVAGAIDMKAIAAELGIGHHTVIDRSLALGLREARKRRKFDDAARNKIAVLANTLTANGVARATGWDLRTVRRVAAEDGLVFAEPAPRPVRETGERKPRAPRIRKARTAVPKPAPVAARPSLMTKVSSDAVVELSPKPVAHQEASQAPRHSVVAAVKAKPVTGRRADGKRLQMMRDVLRTMKRKGYFPPENTDAKR